MKLGVRFQVIFLAVIVLSIYYVTLSAGFNSVDDYHIIASYGMNGGKNLTDIFRISGIYYFRPLIELSYYLDNMIWGMHPRFMHLENILFHLFNSLLVFFVAKQVADAWLPKANWFPLASALLFAVHPINTESVSWIAGRTDPLAGLFIFAAIWCLLQGFKTDRLLYLWPALLLFSLGAMTKEIAFCFLPVAMLLTIYWPGTVRIRKTVLLVLVGITSGSALLALAFAMFSKSYSVNVFLTSKTNGVLEILQTFFMALGFYLKKLIIPLPLNFAIDTVSTFYILPGIVFALLLPFWLKRQRLPALLAALCCIFLLPALIISVKHVAWTPFAERYLYLPSAFFCMGFVSMGSAFMGKVQRQHWLSLFFMGVAFGAVMITVRRNLVWHDNLTLYQDAVRKSPDFGAVHLELGVALLQNGRLKEGRAEFETAERLNKRPSLKNRIRENLMAVRLQEGDYQGAREYFYQNFKDKKEADPEFLRLLNKADEKLASQSAVLAVRNGIYCDMINTYEILYSKTLDPFNLYQDGILALRCGDNIKALAFLHRAVQEAPVSAFYRAAATKLLLKLETQQ